MQYADRTKRIGQTIFIQDTNSGYTANDLRWPHLTLPNLGTTFKQPDVVFLISQRKSDSFKQKMIAF